MKLPRRRFLQLAAGAAALPIASRMACAQTYPTRPVHLTVVSGAGSGPDIVARLIGQSLSERFGQPIVVDDRPGGGGNIATEAVVMAPPDGYTLLMFGTESAINPTLFEKLNFNFIHDIAPVADVIRLPIVMQIIPSLPAKTVPEFIAYANANPGKLNFASPGVGTPQHVAGELFNMMAGIDMVHVPYQGGAAVLTAMLSEQVQVGFLGVGSLDYFKDGELRPLAVTTTTRSELLPDVPTMGEFLPGFEASGWFGVGVPKNTPAEIVDALNKAINAALADSKMKAQLADIGAEPVPPMSPAEFGKFIAAETEKWSRVVKLSGAKPL